MFERDAICVLGIFEFFPDLASQELGQERDGASGENWETRKLFVVRDVEASLNSHFCRFVFFFLCSDHQTLSFFLLMIIMKINDDE